MDNDTTRNATSAALEAFAHGLGERSTLLLGRDDLEDRVTDLITDLMLYADRCGMDALRMSDRARMHFVAEHGHIG